MKIAWFLVWAFRIVFFSVLLTPLLMLLLWWLKPSLQKGITIIDKTVLDKAFEEHASLFWYMNSRKWIRPDNGDAYQADKDYFGFFPGEKQAYTLKGLEGLPDRQLDSIAKASEYLYITDSYGIYHNEWFKDADREERSSHLYGGLAPEDMSLLHKMDVGGKTIICEFNTLANPTTDTIRSAFENQFGLRWTGWIGRYFESLDSATNKELPHWLLQNYIKQYKKWPFQKAGIVFVNENDRIEILEYGEELLERVPKIYTKDKYVKETGLPARIYYPFWFDIMAYDTRQLEALSYYYLPTNQRGDSLLKTYGIPGLFPAVLKRKSSPDRAAFYYFSGDYCDNPVSLKRSYFRGIRHLSEFYYDETDNSDRQTFFWLYYLPLLDNILKD